MPWYAGFRIVDERETRPAASLQAGCVDREQPGNLRQFPEDVKDNIGHALWFAQTDRKHDSAKPLKGFSGSGVLEIIEGFEGNAYRAVYTVKFAGFVYVLHCFQKKSKRGRKTPQMGIDLIWSRLRLAETDHKQRT